MRLGSCANLAAASLAALRESLLFVVGLSLSLSLRLYLPYLSLCSFYSLLLFVVVVVVVVGGGDGGGGKWR